MSSVVNPKNNRYFSNAGNCAARIARMGRGPSSSHTASPELAAKVAVQDYLQQNPEWGSRMTIDIHLIGSARLTVPLGTGDGHGVRWGLFNGLSRGFDSSFSQDQTLRKYNDWIQNDHSSKVWFSNYSFQLIINDAKGDLGKKYSVGGKFQFLSEQQTMGTYWWESVGSGITFLNGEKLVPPYESIASVTRSLEKMTTHFLHESPCSTQCSRHVSIPSPVDTQWMPNTPHSFFNASNIFQERFKTNNQLNDLIFLSVFKGMRANDMGQETLIFPTKGSSGVAFSAWAIAQFDGLKLELLIAHADDYFQNYLQAGASTAASKEGCMAETGPASAGLAYALVLLRRGTVRHGLAAARFMHLMIKGLTCLPDDGAVRSPCTERDELFSIVANVAAYHVLSNHCTITKDDWEREIKDCILIGRLMPVQMKETMDSATYDSLHPMIRFKKLLHSKWHPISIANDVNSRVNKEKSQYAEAFVYKTLAFVNLNHDLFSQKELLPRILYDVLTDAMVHYINALPSSFLHESYPYTVLKNVSHHLLSYNNNALDD